MVLASNPELIEDVKKAPDDHLSFNEPVEEVRILPSALSFDSYSSILLVSPGEIYSTLLGKG
jgi:hypothetical protein